MKHNIMVRVKDTYAKMIKRGYPLLTKEMCKGSLAPVEAGDILSLVDERGQFLAQGYYGVQNKGLGWTLTKEENKKIDARFFSERMDEAFGRRAALFADEETTAMRVFNGEGDGIGGLVIEYFDGFYVVHWYNEGIYRFKAWVVSYLSGLANCKGIYEKKRFCEGGQYIQDQDFVTGEVAPAPLVILENGISYATYLDDGAMVGIFLDQREVRKKIGAMYASGKTVLNTFSYTGAFSVAAAVGGAKQTTSVDVANRSREKTKEQFLLNGIELSNQQIIVDDVFGFFKYAHRKSLSYDLVILDPPSFARTKKTRFSAEKDYTNLLKEAILITNESGVIVASTNCASFSMAKFKQFVREAFLASGRSRSEERRVGKEC